MGRDQDHLIALADETAGVALDITEGLTDPLYDFKADIEGPGGAELVGILDLAGNFTGTNVEDALAELAGGGGGVSVIDSIADGDTVNAPSRNAVYDALETKQNVNVTLSSLIANPWVGHSIPVGTAPSTVAQLLITPNTFPARDSTSNVVAKPITDFAFTLLDDANNTAARTTLGLGTLATQNGTFSGTSSGTNTGDQTLAGLGGQPLDATLTALSGQNWVLNSMPLGTGADTVSQLALGANTFPARSSVGNVTAKTITDFGFSLLDDANAAAGLLTLGAQAADPTLTALAGANWVLNSVPVGTGADTLAQTNLTANTLLGRSSAGNVAAKAITDAAFAAIANMTAKTSFTPTVVGGTTAGVGTYTTQAGYYVLFGSLCFFKLTVAITAHTGTGVCRVTLPLTAANDSANCPIAIGIIDNYTVPANTQVLADVLANTNQARLLGVTIGGGITSGQTLDTAFSIQLAGFYFV